MIKDKYLPIGSVLMLKSGTKRVMIVGYNGVTLERKNEVFDYIGVLFPEGIIDTSKTLLFNHEQIDSVSHYGLYDDESNNFLEKLNKVEINETLD